MSERTRRNVVSPQPGESSYSKSITKRTTWVIPAPSCFWTRAPFSRVSVLTRSSHPDVVPLAVPPHHARSPSGSRWPPCQPQEDGRHAQAATQVPPHSPE